ncbi:hypothetical protein GGF46_003728 [Coemansia sp. RSA 552]|nr:hypothetical protein GGF46_003728 [Coemansia sp. RSA 552]
MEAAQYHVAPPSGTHVRLKDVPLGEWYPLLMQWQVPVLISATYTALALAFSARVGNTPRQAAKKKKKTGLTPMSLAVFVHNAALAAYSAWAFWSVFPPFVGKILHRGLHEGLCDTDGELWNSVLFVHLYLFYVSKYYELMDTAIILLKGRKASLLQIYHHAGVILIMHLANYTASPSSIFIVWENAGVHTVMYSYYALTTLGINPPGKQYLTSLQIFQFLFGQTAALLYFFRSGCATPLQGIWPWALTAYLLPLIYLFVQFFYKTYGPKPIKAE